MRVLAFALAPLALAAAQPALAQDHAAHAQHAPPPPTDEVSSPANAADAYYDPAVMARARAQLLRESGGMRVSAFYVDQLEATFNDGAENYAWRAQGWHGGDINRFWWKSEGAGAFDGELERAELQLLYSRAITPYFDAQAGLRQTYRPEGERTDLVLALQGLAPYWLEVSAEAFLSNEGELTARAEAEYDLRLTQRLVLQPRAELNFSADDIPEFALADGVTNFEVGARLRYQVRPNFAPYVGVEWDSALGGTRNLAEAQGDEPDKIYLVAGIHAFF